MTVLPTILLTGDDQLVKLSSPPDITREASVQLPDNIGPPTKLITQDRLVNIKWSEPGPNERLVNASSRYIAYLVNSVKSNSLILKITDQALTNKVLVKDIKGHIKDFVFQNPGVTDDDVIAVLSTETEQSGLSRLWLSVYEICETDKGSLNTVELCRRVVKEGVAGDAVPRINVQRVPNDGPVVVALAVLDDVQIITLSDEEEPQIQKIDLEDKNEVVSLVMTIADGDLHLATCTRHGCLTFRNVGKQKLLTDPYYLFDNNPNYKVNWMGFTDDGEDVGGVTWENAIIATDTELCIFSLKTWEFTYKFHLKLSQEPEFQAMFKNMRYDIDSRGRFFMLSAPQCPFLILLELSCTQGYQRPDIFSKLFCYPVKSGFYDLAICDVERQENVVGRFEDSSVRDTIKLIAISNNAMYKCDVVFDSGYQAQDNTVSPSQPPLMSPSPTPPPSAQLSPPPATTPPREHRESAERPKTAPRCTDLRSVGPPDADLLPTPLPTPTGHEAASRSEQEFLKILTSTPISISAIDKSEVDKFETDLLAAENRPEYNFTDHIVSVIRTYEAERRPDGMCSAAFYEVLSRYILVKGFTQQGAVKNIVRAFPRGSETHFVDFFLSLLNSLLATETNRRLALSHFQYIENVVTDLYRSSIPNPELASSLFMCLIDELVYSCKNESQDKLFHAEWIEFVRKTVNTLIKIAGVKESTNSASLADTARKVAALGLSLPAAVDTEMGKVTDTGMSGDDNTTSPTEPSAPPDAHLRIISLLQYLDNTPDGDFSFELVQTKVTEIVNWTGEGDEERVNTANAIVDSYHAKTWFHDLVLRLHAAEPGIAPLFESRLSEKLSTWLTDHDIPISRRSRLPRPGRLEPGNYRYSSGTSCLSFSVQRSDHIALIDFMNEVLFDLVMGGSTGGKSRDSYSPRVGDLVACFRGHRTCQRGQVVNVHSEDDIVVLLIDYGEVVQTNGECLSALPLFRQVPARCHRVRVHGITCPEEHSASVMEEFVHLVSGEEMKVSPVSEVGEEGSVSVAVRFHDDKDLASLLQERGLAAWTNGKCDQVWAGDIEDTQQSPPDWFPTSVGIDREKISLLTNAYVSIQKVSRSWHNTEPEIRDVVLFEVKRALGLEALYTKKGAKNGHGIKSNNTSDSDHAPSSTPSSRPASKTSPGEPAPRSKPSSSTASTDSVTMVTETVAAKPARAEQLQQAASSRQSSRSNSPRASSSSRKHSSRSSTPNNLIPKFSSLDIRESEKREEKVQYLDPSKSASLRDINKGLKKAATDIDSISRKGNRVNESELRNLLESSIVSKEPDYESDLRKHATLFYENAYAMLKQTLGDFYQKEVIGKLRETADRLHAKHEKISFPVDQTRINGDVAAIVKTVEKTVQEVLDKSLCEDETLRVYIQRSLLPCWKKTLDHIYETFDATLKHELNHYISSMPRYDRSESETLAQLDRISWAIDELARCQDDARSRFMAMSSKIENELCQAVGNMYMRREQSER